MITKITGVLENVDAKENYREVDVYTPSGLTYRVVVPTKEFYVEIDTDISLFTSYQVREESQVLYGFETRQERDFFEKLISVSGIGPKIGISLLSMFRVDEITQLILAGDHKSLSKASGLGPKGAKKIILELAGILSKHDEDIKEDEQKILVRELSEALRSLGFKGDELKKMQRKAGELLDENPDITIEDLLQRSLRGT